MTLLQDVKNRISFAYGVALLVAINGFLLFLPVLQRGIAHANTVSGSFDSWKEALRFLDLLEIPGFVVGFVLVLMSLGLLIKSRISWFFALLLLVATVCVDVFILKKPDGVTFFSIFTLAVLAFYWRRYDHYSLATGSFFAVVSIASLIVYSTLGTLYIGEGFAPPVTDLPSAFYFAIVVMSTVGFGDIVPHTTDARFFTLTVIILGITIFAISVASIAGPLISNNIQRIVKGRITHMARKNHYILVGVGSLAQNVYKGLTDRGEHVTVVCTTGSQHDLPEKADIIEGDPSAAATLKMAGAEDAKYIVTLCDSDAENVFTILAAKEVAGDDTQIIALVNETRNMPKVKRVNPTMVLSLPLLGSELLVRTLQGDQINNDLITEMFFGKRTSLA
ncbi:voltage-gated potassium channel protein [Pseudomonas psychrophila]|uniref:voltage-gated potassium channel protein n=1 Tax=Pseudomonas psychrophila TaxID=122355 RepID=UPI000653FC1A|nr:voltage-gated potassium channel protein [Pseudomonas psychrophila]KMN00765.1 voltage-gated potassium channel TrkA [Pseudomonas psychrophila]QIE33977.1 voltage-gated potassium channel protein [Pseudomonas psychrophila]WVI96068.1 voltage-gated potassium channel protein [Pseudomonas psychrophila]